MEVVVVVVGVEEQQRFHGNSVCMLTCALTAWYCYNATRTTPERPSTHATQTCSIDVQANGEGASVCKRGQGAVWWLTERVCNMRNVSPSNA